MPTIDDIRIKLAVDGADVKKGVDSANTALKAIERGSRTVSLKITATDQTKDTLSSIAEKIKGLGTIPIEAGVGGFDARKLSQDLQEEMGKPEYLVKVPIGLDTKLTKTEAVQTRKDIEAALAKHNIIVTVDWQFAAEPKGGWPGGGGPAGGAGPRGGGPGPAGPTGLTAGGPRPGPASGPAPAGPTAGTTRAKRQRSAEQRATDERIRRDMADIARAEKAGDAEAKKKSEADLKAARAEQRRQASEAREAEKAARAAGAPPAEPAAPAAAPEPSPPPPPAAGEGLGGRRAGERRAKKAKAAEIPTGKPQANVRAKGTETTTIPEGPKPFAGRGRTNLGAPEKGAFVGKGTSKNFRGGSPPRNLMPAGEELTPEGIREFKKGLNVLKAASALSGEPVTESQVADMMATFPKEYFFSVKSGEAPATANPAMGRRIEESLAGRTETRKESVPSISYAPKLDKQGNPVLDKEGLPVMVPVMGPKKVRESVVQAIQGRRGEALATWAERMRAEGVGAGLSTKEEVLAYWKTFKGKQRRRLYENMGLPDVEGEMSDPLANPAIAEAFLEMRRAAGMKFAGQVEESGGANVRLKAGTRKGGKVKELQDEITGTETLKTALGKRRRSKEEKAEHKAEIDALKAAQAKRGQRLFDAKGNYIGPPEMQAQAMQAKAERERRMVEAGMQAGTIAAKLGGNATSPSANIPPPDPFAYLGKLSPLDIADVGGARMAMGAPKRAREIEARYGRMRKAAGMPGLTIGERSAALQRLMEDLLIQRAEGGIFGGGKFGPAASSPIKLAKVRGFGESAGAGANIGRSNPYWWKKLSGQILKNQPYCTLCGMSRTESHRTLGKDLTIGHILSQARGGEHDAGNLMPLCSTCNSWMGQASFSPLARWTGARPSNITKHPKLQGATPDDFRPGGRLFGVRSIRDALKAIKGRAEGGTLRRWSRSKAAKRQKDEIIHQWAGLAMDLGAFPSEEAFRESLSARQKAEREFQRMPNHGWQPEDIAGAWDWQPPLTRHAEGGEIKHTGLLGRMAQHGDPRAITLVGERGPELIVQGENGEAEVVPTHEVSTWVQRMREGKGVGKDLTHRATGGPTGGFNMRGRQGFQTFADLARGGTVSGADIMRVFVVNWPAAFTGQAGRPGRVTLTTPQGAPLASMRAQSGTQQPGGQGPQVVNPQGQPLAGVAGLAAGQLGPRPVLPLDDPRFRLAQRLGRLGERAGERQTLQAERTRVSVALAENPVRAFAVAFSQFIQTRTGRAGLLERAGTARIAIATADEAHRVAQAEQDKYEAYKVQLRGLKDLTAQGYQLTAQEQKEQDILETQLPLQKEAAETAEVSAKAYELIAHQKASTEVLGGTAQQLKNLAVGGLSVITAGVAFRAAFAAMNTAIGLGAAAAGEFVERSTGYLNATAALGDELGKQTRTLHGNAEAATAATLAQSGLAEAQAASVRPELTGRAAGVAGNQALQEQIVQLAAGANIARENAGAGLPPGFDLSLVRGTGGPFDLGILPGILSQYSTSNLLANQLNALPAGGGRSGLTQGVSGGDLNTGSLFPGDIMQANAAAKLLSGTELGATPVSEADKALNDWLTTVNDRAKKGRALNQLIVEPDLKKVNDTIKAFEDIGASDFARALTTRRDQGQGLALTGPITGFAAASLLQSQQTAPLIPTQQELIRQFTSKAPGGLSDVDVQLRDIARRGEFQRTAALPAQLALQFAANPLVPYNEARLRPSGTIEGKQFKDNENTIGAYQAAFEKYTKYAERAQAKINSEVETGRKILSNWIGPDLLGDITQLGKDIKGIQLDLQQRSLNIEVSQYNNEIRIASRNLRYAQDFTKAIKGNVHDTIGGLQGENYLLARQSQLLSQQLQQRQINLQLAVAGFQVAGETPEERAARQAQAIAEAQFAQKQLDIQKQLTGNEFQVGLKQNADAIGDLSAQIKLLRESKAFAIDQAAAEKAISDMTDELEYLKAQAQSRFDQAVQDEQVFLGYVTQIEDASHQALKDLNGELSQHLIPAFIVAGKDAGRSAVDFVKSSIIGALTDSLGGAGGQVTWEILPGSNKRLPAASGMLFDTTGPTDLTVGEAGNEKVAILRNPRPMSLPEMAGTTTGGGKYNFTLNFNGATVRTNADITAIARAVQDELNRALRLAGVR